jgi:hypothetical protein
MKSMLVIVMCCYTLCSFSQSPAADEGKLALKTAEAGDKIKADSLSKEYYDHYLAEQPDSILFNKDNLSFIVGFPGLMRIGDRYFAAFYSRGAELEKQMGWMQGFTHSVVAWKITEKYIDSRLYKDGKPLGKRPNWERYGRQIEKAYGKTYADDILILAEKRFYQATKNWSAYMAVFELQLQQHPLTIGQHFLGGMVDDVWQVNPAAWTFFQQCDDTVVLKKALDWSALTVRLAKEANFGCDQYMDTEANLLYKLGRGSEAVRLEQEALDLSKGQGQDYIATLAKMKTGEKTW